MLNFDGISNFILCDDLKNRRWIFSPFTSPIMDSHNVTTMTSAILLMTSYTWLEPWNEPHVTRLSHSPFPRDKSALYRYYWCPYISRFFDFLFGCRWIVRNTGKRHPDGQEITGLAPVQNGDICVGPMIVEWVPINSVEPNGFLRITANAIAFCRFWILLLFLMESCFFFF